MPEPGRRRRPLAALAVLVLASATVMTLDGHDGTGSPVEPVRTAVGTVLGPVESASAAVVRPFTRLGGFLDDNRDLRHQVATLTAENARLRGQAALAPVDRHRIAELDALTRTAQATGYSLVAAHVVAIGPAQSFTRTVTIDAGTSSGVRADMTVVAGSGLVGRVVRATPSNATVLLIVDRSSTVGGRVGSDMEIGNVSGTGALAGSGGLELDLADASVTPMRGDVVVTWGSPDGVPYVAGIPIGRVAEVRANPRTLSKHAIVTPYVDFSALDLVGVVVPRGTRGDRPVIAGGSTGSVR
ncbi:MAG: rod shape-determining protein MreC [Marmoricola sp.]